MNSKENYNNSTLDLAVKDMRDAPERTHHAALLDLFHETAHRLFHEGYTKLEIAPFLKVARERGITDAEIQAFYDSENDQDVDLDVRRIPLEGYRDYTLFLESLGIIYVDFRRDVYSDRVEYTKDGSRWQPITQDLEDEIKSEIEIRVAHVVKTKKEGEKHVPLHWGRDKWQQYRNTRTSKHRVNTFTEWLATLPKWDGVPRLKTMLADCFGVENTPLISAVSEMLLVAIVLRGYAKTENDKPVKFDLVPVLIGELEGEGKSTFCAFLLPPEKRDQWYQSSIPFNEGDSDLRTLIEGKAIGEWSELEGLTRAETERVKRIISDPFLPKCRKKYDRDSSYGIRTDIIIGTTNNARFIPHATGRARRWIPVVIPSDCSPQSVRAYLERDRAQLWAEAKARKDAVKLYLPRELEREQAQVNKEFMNRDLELEQIVLNAAERLFLSREFTMTELVQRIKEERHVQDGRALDMQISKMLQNHGWERNRKRVEGRTKRLWSKPQTVVDDDDIPF